VRLGVTLSNPDGTSGMLPPMPVEAAEVGDGARGGGRGGLEVSDDFGDDLGESAL
jgi:hypothetical protein